MIQGPLLSGVADKGQTGYPGTSKIITSKIKLYLLVELIPDETSIGFPKQ